MATPIPSNQARFSLSEIALATRGVIRREVSLGADAAVGVFSDSRAVTPGGVFVALRGEVHDGHDFLSAAVGKGARVLVVQGARRLDPSCESASIVEVDDTLVAWGDLARAHLASWRARSGGGRVIAITGSAGKTTTKELTAALLGQVGPTHSTAGNLNNRVGVPAVIFALEPSHRYCVLEMGMSLPGELDAITAFARPDVSVVVNVGVAHAEGVGGREGVMREKGAVYRALGRKGVAIVNADDEFARRAAAATRATAIRTFGRGTPAQDRRSGSLVADPAEPPRPREYTFGTPDYRLVQRTPDGEGSRVVLACAGRQVSIYLPLPGEAAALDLAAALAAQEAASDELLPSEAIERALARVNLSGRGTILHLARDLLVLDDSYNANPASMRAALETLSEIAGGRRKVTVLGEMRELGALAKEEHEALGDAVVRAGVALAIGCGGLVDLALDRAAAQGVEVICCRSTAEAAAEARRRVQAGDAVLVKGSRGVAVENVIVGLAAAG